MASQALSYIFFFSLQICIIYAHLFESSDNFSTSMKFLSQLNGVEKGNNREGVNELKKHLSYLGYMNCPKTLNDREDENTFDDCLELTLKKYQEFYSLNVTGVLNDATIAKLRKRRCPTKNTSTSFHKHYAFIEGLPRWHTAKLKYALKNPVKKEYKEAIEHALRQWESVSPFRFSTSTIYCAADIRISFEPPVHDDDQPFIGEDEDTLAHTFPPPDGRIHFNEAVHWSTTGANNAHDIQSVALHELGHALGLAHSNVEDAVMYPGIARGERKGLHRDDIAGIKALYHF